MGRYYLCTIFFGHIELVIFSQHLVVIGIGTTRTPPSACLVLISSAPIRLCTNGKVRSINCLIEYHNCAMSSPGDITACAFNGNDKVLGIDSHDTTYEYVFVTHGGIICLVVLCCWCCCSKDITFTQNTVLGSQFHTLCIS